MLVLEQTRMGSGSSSTFVKFEFEKFDFCSKKQSSKSSTFDFAKFDKFGFEFFRVRSNTTSQIVYNGRLRYVRRHFCGTFFSPFRSEYQKIVLQFLFFKFNLKMQKKKKQERKKKKGDVSLLFLFSPQTREKKWPLFFNFTKPQQYPSGFNAVSLLFLFSISRNLTSTLVALICESPFSFFSSLSPQGGAFSQF